MGLQINKTLPELLKTMLREQIDAARTRLLDNSPDFNDVIHDVRTSLKKIRAYLLLLKTELDEDIYKYENKSIRAEGKQIAELRDSYVVIMTLEKLTAIYQYQLRNNTVAAIQKILASGYEEKRQQVLEQEKLKNLAERLLVIKNRINDWNLQKNDDTLAFDRLKDCYEKGAGQKAAATASRTDDDLHNWRKNVKHLWYQVRVFEPFRLEILTGYAESLHSLSDYLGEDHDMAVLNGILLEQGGIHNKHELKVLQSCINMERDKLQVGAFMLARSIYAESPVEFKDRIFGYWNNRGNNPV